MKNVIKILLLLIIFGCSSDNSEDTINPEAEISIDNITPLRVKIGDTITMTGSNLDKLSYVHLIHNDRLLKQNDVKIERFSFISKSNEKITYKVPKLVREDISILIPDIDKKYKLNLVGFIQIQNDITVRQSQVLTEKIAFINDGNKIYKSIDGFYKWEILVEFSNKNISSFFFLNENIGWIAVMEESGRNIYSTLDGGKNLSLKYHINDLSNKILDGSDIRKIQFTSQNKGFFKDGNGNIFVADNNSFENVYNHYPNLSSLPFGRIKLSDFNAVSDDLIFLAPNGDPYLIKIDNQSITYSEFDLYPLAPQFFDNIGYVQVNSDIYKTSDLGNSWTKIKTFDNYYPQLHFFNEDVGFAMLNYTPEVFYKTIDGGNSWIDYWTPPYSYNNKLPLITPKHIWLFGDLWKYIEE
ncbi:hypothetical protein [uncultured Gelidibacter sp.]|uniref:sialidase family protein n=1 Tax=uncultured Gelidibacter sp. TaxID=259318 RepID=UPI00261D354D|nr:hypothetical protein [uncultured Gelidibacter sp.]